MRKLELEERKLQYENDTAAKRDRSDRLREYVTLLGPIVTIVTLAATLFVQNFQFIPIEQDKNEVALDAQWQETVKNISQAAKLPPGIVALHAFLNSPKYADKARILVIQLLTNNNPDPIFFDDLFEAAFVPVGWNNLNDVVKLDRAINNKLLHSPPRWFGMRKLKPMMSPI